MMKDSRQQSLLSEVFDLETFSEQLSLARHLLIEELSRDEIEGVRLQSPTALMEKAQQLMTEQSEHATEKHKRLEALISLFLETGIKVNSRGYMGRQFSSVAPVSAVFDMVTAIAPQPASYYEAGQLANVADKLIAKEFAPLIGWKDDQFEMVSTSGASLANLTAALVARNTKLPQSWKQGPHSDQTLRPAIALSDEAHYSVSRIAGIIGLGEDQIIRLPLNERRQICPVRANVTLENAQKEGFRVFCIIASAGTTSIGAIDPLEGLAAIAKRFDAWLHIDAAHNGAFLVSDHLRNRLKGIEQADSFCLDAHKTLFVPGMSTLLFYKDRSVAKSAFPQRPSYVFDPFEDEMSQFESGIKNFECTKRSSPLNLWITWALYGREFFAEKLDYLIDLTEQTYHYLHNLPDFKVMHRPESNIICFQYLPVGTDYGNSSAFQLSMRNAIRAEGQYFISKVDLDGNTALRLVFMNHRITLCDVKGLVQHIRDQGQEVLKDPNINAPSSSHTLHFKSEIG